MTSLISSFIIDPFVRQARRFSQAPVPTPQVPGSPQSSAQVAESHANIRHNHTNFTESSPHDDHREADNVEFLTDGNATSVTTSQSKIGGDGVGSGQSWENTVRPKPSHPILPPAPCRNNSDEPLIHPENALFACQTSQTIVSSNSALLNAVDDMTANRLHSNADNEMPPISPRLDRNMSRTTMQDHAKMASSLPADDGMRHLRERIHGIRSDSVSQEEKARKMHDLMTEEWQNSQLSLRPLSPASMISQDVIFGPGSPLSTLCSPASPLLSSTVPVDPQNPFNIHPEDLQPSYRPVPEPEPIADDGHMDESPTETPEPVLGCKHYQRNVKIQCFDCKTWHTCRHCHDAAVPSHHLNRRATENMLCMQCWTPQAAGQYCKNCNERGAWYYCDICKLWDDDGSKRIYHCSDCGICRRGEGLGKDFVHCKVSRGSSKKIPPEVS
jgi:CHY zinc finger